MGNPENLATWGTQEEENKTKTQQDMCWTPLYVNKNTTRYVLDTTICKQTQQDMCWTPLYVNKHNKICVGHHYM